MSKAQVTRRGFLDMQVCVPKDYTDAQLCAFAEAENPCGTTNGWRIRRQGDPALSGCDERVQCEQDPSCVHVMLTAPLSPPNRRYPTGKHDMMTLEELRAELAIVVPHDSDLLSSIDSAIRVRDELRRDIECHRRTEQEIRKRLQRFNDPGARLEACVQVVLQTYRETEEAYLDASASLDALRKRIEDAPVAHVDDRVGAPERLMDIGYYEGQRVRLVRE